MGRASGGEPQEVGVTEAGRRAAAVPSVGTLWAKNQFKWFMSRSSRSACCICICLR